MRVVQRQVFLPVKYVDPRSTDKHFIAAVDLGRRRSQTVRFQNNIRNAVLSITVELDGLSGWRDERELGKELVKARIEGNATTAPNFSVSWCQFIARPFKLIESPPVILPHQRTLTLARSKPGGITRRSRDVFGP